MALCRLIAQPIIGAAKRVEHDPDRLVEATLGAYAVGDHTVNISVVLGARGRHP